MKALNIVFQTTGNLLILFVESLYWSKAAWRNRDKVFAQMVEIGNNTFPVAALIAFFVGGVLALQTGPLLAEFGIQDNIGGIVGLSLVKELGPVMGTILVVGRVGSAMTAEIGSMSVYDEIDALKTMDINPVRYLVMPRVLATIITLPILVLYIDIIGWIGGALVATFNHAINVPFQIYFTNLSEIVEFKDLINGLVKSTFFAVIISTVCCYVGLVTRGGPRGIGLAVTRAVVLSFTLILVSDYLITRFLIILNLD